MFEIIISYLSTYIPKANHLSEVIMRRRRRHHRLEPFQIQAPFGLRVKLLTLFSILFREVIKIYRVLGYSPSTNPRAKLN